MADKGLERAERVRSAGILLVVVGWGLGVLISQLGLGTLAGVLDLLRIVLLLVGLPLLLIGVLRVRRARSA